MMPMVFGLPAMVRFDQSLNVHLQLLLCENTWWWMNLEYWALRASYRVAGPVVRLTRFAMRDSQRRGQLSQGHFSFYN
jgi:hypothetical protein